MWGVVGTAWWWASREKAVLTDNREAEPGTGPPAKAATRAAGQLRLILDAFVDSHFRRVWSWGRE